MGAIYIQAIFGKNNWGWTDFLVSILLEGETLGGLWISPLNFFIDVKYLNI